MPKLTTRINDADIGRLHFWAEQDGRSVSEYIALAVTEKLERERTRLSTERTVHMFSEIGETNGKAAAWWLDLFRRHGLTI